MTEIWKRVRRDLPFEISSRGRMRRTVDAPRYAGRILRPAKAGWRRREGYVAYLLMHKGRRHWFSAHREVARAFFGEPGPGQVVHHKNANRSDNRAENLEWVTRQQNNAEAGASPFVPGSQHPGAKLTEADVLEIARLIREGAVTRKAIADRYGVTRTTINGIASGKNWGWLTGGGVR